MPEQIGISGFGYIGRRHAAIASQAGLSSVIFDPALTRTAAAPALPPDARAVDSFDDLLACDLLGLVVAGPDRVHAEQVIGSCRSGIPVLVEKPLSESLSSAFEIRRVAELTGVPVLPGYVLRHTRVMQEAVRLLGEGVIGAPVSFHVNLGAYDTLVVADNRFADPLPDQLFFDYSHEWDYLQWLLGPAARGIAHSRTVEGPPLMARPNVVEGMLDLGHTVGTFHLDYVQDPSRRELKLVGDRGTADIDVRNGTISVSRSGEAHRRTYSCAEPREEPFRVQLEHFQAIIAGRELPRVTIEDAIRALAVSETLARSARTESWTSVPEPRADYDCAAQATS